MNEDIGSIDLTKGLFLSDWQACIAPDFDVNMASGMDLLDTTMEMGGYIQNGVRLPDRITESFTVY